MRQSGPEHVRPYAHTCVRNSPAGSNYEDVSAALVGIQNARSGALESIPSDDIYCQRQTLHYTTRDEYPRKRGDGYRERRSAPGEVFLAFAHARKMEIHSAHTHTHSYKNSRMCQHIYLFTRAVSACENSLPRCSDDAGERARTFIQYARPRFRAPEMFSLDIYMLVRLYMCSTSSSAYITCGS